jgi:hypothetical protein
LGSCSWPSAWTWSWSRSSGVRKATPSLTWAKMSTKYLVPEEGWYAK